MPLIEPASGHPQEMELEIISQLIDNDGGGPKNLDSMIGSESAKIKGADYEQEA